MGWKDTVQPIDSVEPVESNWKSTIEPVEQESAPIPAQKSAQPQQSAGWQNTIQPADSPEYQAIRQETDRGFIDNITESPQLISKQVEDAELDTIAKKHNVSKDELRSWLPFLGGSIPVSEASPADWAKAATGFAGNVAFGIPQKLAKKTQSDEMERALDDVQELARARSSNLASGVQAFAGPASVFGKVGGGIARQAVAQGITGAVTGASAARQGEEVEGGVIGAGVGAVLGAGAEKLLGNSTGKVTGEVKEAVEKAAKRDRIVARGGADMQAGIERNIERAAPADEAIGRRIFNADAIDENDARTIVDAYAPESLAKYMDPNAEEGRLFRKQMTQKLSTVPTDEQLERLAVAKLANEKADRIANDLAQDAGIGTKSDSVYSDLRNWAGLQKGSGQGEAGAKSKLAELFRTKHVDDYIQERGLTAARTGFFGRLADMMSDAQYVLRGYDEKYKGLGLEDAHKEINRGLNQMSFPREDFRSRIRDVFRTNRAAGVDNLAVNGEQIIRKVEAGEALTPQEERAFSGFREFWEQGLGELDELAKKDGVDALAIKERLNYIPAQTKDMSELRNVMQDRLDALVRDAQKVNPSIMELRDVPPDLYNALLNSNLEHMETIAFLRTLAGESSIRPQDLNKAFTQAFQGPQGSMRLDTIAKAALQREGKIPMWARETNLYKLADKWTNNTLRHMYLRKGLDQLRGRLHNLETLAGNKPTNETKYVRNLLADITGIRENTAASMFTNAHQAYTSKMNQLAKRASNPVAKITYETLGTIPNILQGTARNVYPNFLGANPRSLIMNATQTFTKTLPEFGGEYGSLLFFRGAMSLGGLRKLGGHLAELERMGLAPRKHVPEAQAYLREGLSRSMSGAPREALRKAAEISMKPYEIAEGANRAIAWGASKMMAADLAAGSGAARRSLERFPTSVRRAVEEAGAQGRWDDAQRIIGEHVINSTQYQYNRASMSEFGRTMGPLFSTFSKWPTATLGQVVEQFRTNGAVAGGTRLAEQLVAPWALLEAADWAMGMAVPGTENEGSDRQNKLFSKEGFSQAAPIGNLKGIVSGDFFTPPVVDTALKAFGGMEDTSKLQKAASNAVYSFAPYGLGGWVRFITDDLTTLYTGERPEGSDFIERSEEGARKLGVNF